MRGADRLIRSKCGGCLVAAAAAGAAGATGIAPSNTVAPAGRRLRRKMDRATAIGIGFGIGGVVIAIGTVGGLALAHALGAF